MSIPNILTTTRFAMIPLFGWSLSAEAYGLAAFLFLLAGGTDMLDGYVARKFNMVTSWGKLADPLADKLMQLTALIILTLQQLVPIAILAVFVLKELAMILGSIFLYKRQDFVVSANWYGKAATVVLYVAIVAMIITKAMGLQVGYFTYAIVIAALMMTLYAFSMYVVDFVKIRKANQK